MNPLLNFDLMKHLILTLGGLLFAGAMTWAQPGPPMGEGRMSPEQRERLQQLRVAFFSEQLELTRAEAEAFWPIVNAHEDALEAQRATMRELTENAGSTEREVREAIERMAELRKTEVDLDTSMLLDLLPVLGPERTASVPRLEREFRKSILDAARNRSSGAPPRGPAPRRNR